MQRLKIGRLTCDYASVASRRICYILAPMALDDRQMAALATGYGCNIVVIHGMDWDNDLTPWPAAGVLPQDECFKGKAADFLSLLRGELIPEVEHTLGVSNDVERTLSGISLSGLFALWAWMECDTFANIGSISGSFWYDGFADWLETTRKPPKSGYAYFSLGDMETQNVNPRYGTVEICTLRVVETLRRAAVRTVFETTSGTHFAPLLPRVERIFRGLKEFD